MRILLIFVFVYFSFIAFAQDSTDIEKISLIEKLLKSSGINNQIEELPSYTIAPLNNQLQQMGLDVFNENQIIKISESYLDKYVDNYYNDLTKLQLNQLVEFYETPVGIKIRKIEGKTTELDSISSMKIISSLTNENKQLINNFVKSAKLEEFNDKIATEIGIVLAKTIFYPQMRKNGKTIKEIESFFSSNKFSDLILKWKSDGIIHSTFDINYYYLSYSTLTESEIQNYTKLYNTSHGKLHLHVMKKSLEYLFQYVFSIIGDSIENRIDK